MNNKNDDVLDKVFDFFLNEDIDIVLDEIEKCEPTGFGLAIAESGVMDRFVNPFTFNAVSYSVGLTSFKGVNTCKFVDSLTLGTVLYSSNSASYEAIDKSNSADFDVLYGVDQWVQQAA